MHIHLARRVLGAVAASLAASLLLGTASPVRAATSPEACLSQRARAWGTLRECERNEQAKAILGRPADAGKCRARFEQTMAVIDTRAAAANVACRYRDNWELSSARATSVVKFLIASGVPANRLVAAGFGEFQPLDPADSEEARNRNRRIELKLTER